jgi:hypothetical protein
MVILGMPDLSRPTSRWIIADGLKSPVQPPAPLRLVKGNIFIPPRGELEACHVNRADGNLLFLKRKNLRHGNQPAT